MLLLLGRKEGISPLVRSFFKFFSLAPYIEQITDIYSAAEFLGLSRKKSQRGTFQVLHVVKFFSCKWHDNERNSRPLEQGRVNTVGGPGRAIRETGFFFSLATCGLWTRIVVKEGDRVLFPKIASAVSKCLQ